MIGRKEKKFYESLEQIFTGVKIEGEGGYINLLKIKSAYYKKILEQWKKEIEENEIIKNSDNFKEEFFEKLYSFFEKYFSESGSVYFAKTARWKKVYEQVYTDNKDVILFWKTNMLYYVKSDCLFQNTSLVIREENSTKEHSFFFDVSRLENKQSNEKKEIIFEYKETKNENNKEITVFDALYSTKGKKTKVDDISKKIQIPEVTIEKAFRDFKKQSEVDFFINKNANKFLTQQLEIYLSQILLATENQFNQQRLNQIKTIKIFALKIIDFIAQFEDELVRIWNKLKFAFNSNYVITLDKLYKSSPELLQKIEKHPNLKKQITEWKNLEMINENFQFKNIKTNTLYENIDAKYQFLPLDTKFFKDIEYDILQIFDNIDESLDGRLVHSENYQALHTLQNKYRGKVQCIYIDPPFNLDKNAGFDYKVNYKNANWATLLENRISIAKELLADTGSIFVRCDYNGNYIVRCLLDDIFGKENFRNEIVIAKTKEFFKTMKGLKQFSNETESLFFYSKKEKLNFFKELIEKKNLHIIPHFFLLKIKTFKIQE